MKFSIKDFFSKCGQIRSVQQIWSYLLEKSLRKTSSLVQWIKIDKKSHKNISIYCIGYITIKIISDDENINSVNPLYLIIGDVDGYIEENYRNKYLNFASTDKNKKVLEKYTKLWDEIKYHIQTTNAEKSGENEKDYMKIKFSSDNDLPLNKALTLHNLTIIVRSVFEKDGKYYPQVFLDECWHEV